MQNELCIKNLFCNLYQRRCPCALAFINERSLGDHSLAARVPHLLLILYTLIQPLNILILLLLPTHSFHPKRNSRQPGLLQAILHIDRDISFGSSF